MLLFILGCLVGGSVGFIFAGLMLASKKEAPGPEAEKVSATRKLSKMGQSS
jgi:hypothetical protein